jgi:hypothetical protein
LEEEEEEDVIMQCLITHKNNQKMDPKCYAGIEHHQLVRIIIDEKKTSGISKYSHAVVSL